MSPLPPPLFRSRRFRFARRLRGGGLAAGRAVALLAPSSDFVLCPPLSDFALPPFGLRSSRGLARARTALGLANPAGSKCLPFARPLFAHGSLASLDAFSGGGLSAGRGIYATPASRMIQRRNAAIFGTVTLPGCTTAKYPAFARTGASIASMMLPASRSRAA